MSGTLGQAAQVMLGRQRSPEHHEGSHMVPYLRSANINDGTLDLSDVKTMNFSPSEQARFRLAVGDVLVTEGSGSRETVGASAVWKGDLPGPVCFQNTLLRIRPREGLSDGRYLAWWARHAHASGQIAAAATGANILHLGAENLRRLPLDLPPLAVQRRIADFLDDQVTRIDQAIGLRERQIELAATRAKTEVDDLVLGHDSATRTDSIWPPFGLVPHSWLQTRLRSIRTDVRTGPFGTQLHADEYVDEGYPIVNPANLVDSGIRALPGMCVDEATRTRLARHVLQQGDVVFARRGELGRSALVTEKQTGWFCGTGSLVVRLHGDQLLPQYLARLLRTRALRWYFETQSVGSTMANLNTSILMAMPLLVPSLDEQVAIDTEAKGIEATGQAIRETLTRALRLLEERKRSLITAAVTGEFDVSNASSRASGMVMDGVGG